MPAATNARCTVSGRQPSWAGGTPLSGIRSAKDAGLTNLPLHDFAQNQIWCAIVAMACELLAWLQMLAVTSSDARR